MRENVPLTIMLVIAGTGALIWFGSNALESWREWRQNHKPK